MKQEALVCRQIVDLVTDWLEGALAEAEREAFEEHLAICADCVAHVEQVRVTRRLTAQLRSGPVGDDLRRRLLEAFRSWRSP
jgi:anti-sigma factor RsiW